MGQTDCSPFITEEIQHPHALRLRHSTVQSSYADMTYENILYKLKQLQCCILETVLYVHITKFCSSNPIFQRCPCYKWRSSDTGDTKKRELLKCIVAAMYSWQHCGTGTSSYRQPCHSVIMDQWNGQQRAFAIKMFYKNNDSLEGAQKEFRRFLI